MPIILLIILLILITLVPGWWVRRVLAKYSEPNDRYSGTGAELARYLLDKNSLQAVTVEETDAGDHYDPTAKAVRLTPDKYAGRSLTAVTVAAHEVGHALQDAQAYAPLRLRGQLVRASRVVEKVGAGALIVAPFAGLLTRVPALGVLMFLAGFVTLATSILVHLATLPTELDASFNRALPELDRHKILLSPDRPHARRLLQAAALTYVAASLMSLVNIGRWWAILRR